MIDRIFVNDETKANGKNIFLNFKFDYGIFDSR